MQHNLDSNTTDHDLCIVCNESLTNGQPIIQIQQDRAVKTFNEASEERGNASLKVSKGQTLHKECRIAHTHKRNVLTAKRKSDELIADEPLRLRSRSSEFSFTNNCFLCGNAFRSTEKINIAYFRVRTTGFLTTIISACNDRGVDDTWAQDVRLRLVNVVDLPSANAHYHDVCRSNFCSKLSIPLRYQSNDQNLCGAAKTGRKSDVSREEAFFQVVEALRRDDDEQTTVTDLVEKMSKITSDPYSTKYMRKKLDQHLGDSVLVTNINGRKDVVTFRTKAAKLLQEFYDAPKPESENQEKKKIIDAAADLIRNEIKCIPTSKSSYPDIKKLSSLEDNLNYVPELLRSFLDRILAGQSNELKVATIGQCIIQLTRPRVVLAPIPLGLGVQMHHQYGSRFLVDSLHSHGICVSYSEVLNFESSAASFKGTDVLAAGQFGQYIADNVDHNVRTLDGHGTIHAMGIIKTVTPGLQNRQCIIPRLTTPGNVDAKIVVRQYTYLKGKSLPLIFKKLPKIEVTDTKHGKLDTLWKLSWSLRPRTPGWSGMMQSLRKGSHPGKASVHFLPMLDLDPTNMTCLYSTLHFIANECKDQGTIPIVTFDQPLWWKSRSIILNENADSILKQTILMLGGFHTTMSYLGSVGNIMEGSGLKEVMELVYAGNAVEHILNGKAYARGVRAHYLVDGALNAIVLEHIYGTTIFSENELDANDTPEELVEALELCDAILREELGDQDVCQQNIFEKIQTKIEAEKKNYQSFRLENCGYSTWL